MRTRDYVQKGETEGKSLLDAMRDGSNEGMQCFDDEIEKFIRAGVVDLDTGLSYASNIGNLRLHLADLFEAQSDIPSAGVKIEPPKPRKEKEVVTHAIDPELELQT